MYNKELNISLIAAIKASKAIMDVYKSNDLGVEIKFDNSPVTKADKAADKIIRDILSEAFPNYALLTEESVDNLNRLNNDYVFIVDPVDGTKDFVAHNDQFTINIGLSYKHEAVMGVIMIPVTNEIYYATKDGGAFYLKDENSKPIRIHVNDKTKDLTVLMSNFHTNEKELNLIKKHSDVISTMKHVGATIKACLIASGKAELSYRLSDGTKEWDTCAMQILLEEAGGYLLKLDGTPIRYNREDVYNRGGYLLINNKKNFLL